MVVPFALTANASKCHGSLQVSPASMDDGICPTNAPVAVRGFAGMTVVIVLPYAVVIPQWKPTFAHVAPAPSEPSVPRRIAPVDVQGFTGVAGFVVTVGLHGSVVNVTELGATVVPAEFVALAVYVYEVLQKSPESVALKLVPTVEMVAGETAPSDVPEGMLNPGVTETPVPPRPVTWPLITAVLVVTVPTAVVMTDGGVTGHGIVNVISLPESVPARFVPCART